MVIQGGALKWKMLRFSKRTTGGSLIALVHLNLKSKPRSPKTVLPAFFSTSQILIVVRVGGIVYKGRRRWGQITLLSICIKSSLFSKGLGEKWGEEGEKIT